MFNYEDFSHLKKKNHVNTYLNTKNYFDKYFKMVLFLPFFFYKWIILHLKSVVSLSFNQICRVTSDNDLLTF